MPFLGMILFLVVFCGGLLFVMYRILGKQATQATDRFTQMSEDFDLKKLVRLTYARQTLQACFTIFNLS